MSPSRRHKQNADFSHTQQLKRDHIQNCTPSSERKRTQSRLFVGQPLE